MTISRRRFLQNSAAIAAAGLVPALWEPSRSIASMSGKTGPFQPTWESLAQYKTPDWFRDAKFGMWAHWGPQCVPEQGDWYARSMYQQGTHDYNYQCAHWGHPSKAGFKEVIHDWKAEEWDPEHLIGLYKGAGAKYFMCLANHHDNFDNFNSTYQEWNSVALGPRKDLVGGWERAVRHHGLRFAVSVHAAHAWAWYEVSQGADTSGPLAGVPYDGNLTKADGAGKWWEGLDPQELYAQNHKPMGLEWNWDNHGNGDLPSAAYCEKFYKRITELYTKYRPDQIYFDDTTLPLYPVSDVGLRIAAEFYNSNIRLNRGNLEAVVNGKGLTDQQRQCMVLDLERGVSGQIEPLPFQTDTCIGQWHYNIDVFHNHSYKTPSQVIHMLVDIVSKNGTLMLNIPLPGSGKPDTDELDFLSKLTAWMDMNSDGIYGTRPWYIFGEGPMSVPKARRAGNFNESNPRYTAQDIRFAQRGETLFATALAWPEHGSYTIESLGPGGSTRQCRSQTCRAAWIWTIRFYTEYAWANGCAARQEAL